MATQSKNPAEILNMAQNELKLLEIYSIALPNMCSPTRPSSATIDMTSVQILSKFQPIALDEIAPISVQTFARHKISPAVWAAKSEDDRKQHFRKFLKDFSKPNNGYVLSTDGTRTVPTPNGGKKPHQRKRLRAEKTTTHKKRKRLF